MDSFEEVYEQACMAEVTGDAGHAEELYARARRSAADALRGGQRPSQIIAAIRAARSKVEEATGRLLPGSFR